MTTSDRLDKYDLTVPFLLAAVDPAAEDRLVGLAGTVVDGGASVPTTRSLDRRGAGRQLQVPVLTPPSLHRRVTGGRGSRGCPLTPGRGGAIDLERR